MKKKIKLKDLKVKSFKTTNDKSPLDTVKGGGNFISDNSCGTKCFLDCDPETAQGCGGGSNGCGTSPIQCGTNEIITCLVPC